MLKSMSTAVTIIADIVRSRDLVDRGRAQSAFAEVFARVDEHRPFPRPLAATVGDEFQGIAADVAHALWATALARLLLPDGVECRFGIGVGDIRSVRGADAAIEEGDGWTRARAAIDEAHARQARRAPWLRTWFTSDMDADAPVDAYLLVRDQVIDRMKARERRLAAGMLLGRSQAQLARDEGVTQSAVSQALARSGAAAIVAGEDLLREGWMS